MWGSDDQTGRRQGSSSVPHGRTSSGGGEERGGAPLRLTGGAPGQTEQMRTRSSWSIGGRYRQRAGAAADGRGLRRRGPPDSGRTGQTRPLILKHKDLIGEEL